MYNVVGRLALDFQLEIGVGGGGGRWGSERQTQRDRDRDRQGQTDRQTETHRECKQIHKDQKPASKKATGKLLPLLSSFFFSYNNEERLLWENEKECGDRDEE